MSCKGDVSKVMLVFGVIVVQNESLCISSDSRMLSSGYTGNGNLNDPVSNFRPQGVNLDKNPENADMVFRRR